MILNIENENIGYSVATATNELYNQNYLMVGNPNSFRYDTATASLQRTGSLDLYIYNITTDNHEYLNTFYKIPPLEERLILTTEQANVSPTGPSHSLHTENNNEFILYNDTSDKNIEIDSYVVTLEDDIGHSLDMYKEWVAVGCRYYRRNLYKSVDTSSVIKSISGSSVDIYNTKYVNHDPFKFAYTYLSHSLVPSEVMSGSFGYSVSINGEWLAVGSDLFDNKGAVHMFRRGGIDSDTTFCSWSFHSTLTGSDSIINDRYGISVHLNKAEGINVRNTVDYSGSLVIGTGRVSGSRVYYYEFNNNVWQEKWIFDADRTWQKLAFIDYLPLQPCPNYTADSFGYSVSMWKDTVIIGAPTDRWLYEYSGSRPYRQGSFYIFERCPVEELSDEFKLVKKSYGNDHTLKNNKLGYSVDIWEDKAVVACPKDIVDNLTACYIQGTLLQENYCVNELEDVVTGQWIYCTKSTSSLEWDITNVFQKKKKYLMPQRAYGYDVDINDGFIIIGSPTKLSGSNRIIDIDTSSYLYATAGAPNRTIEYLTGSLDVSGKSYIYNLNNFRNNYYVGNIFYKNGIIVLNTSGSVFEGLWFNELNSYEYEYQINYKSKQTLYEKQITCTVEPGEFNVSTNPTALNVPLADFDINKNGKFDWQDLDILLMYMQYKNTEYSTAPTTNWSSSIVTTDDEISFYQFYSTEKEIHNTEKLYSSSYATLNNNLFGSLDFNQDNKIDSNDMYILWKYYAKRLSQNNYEKYITPNSQRRLLNEVLDYMDSKTLRNIIPTIHSNFNNYSYEQFNKNGDPTGSYCAPFVTTIGLYSNGGDLIGVAKLGSPIKLPPNFPVNFNIKIDF